MKDTQIIENEENLKCGSLKQNVLLSPIDSRIHFKREYAISKKQKAREAPFDALSKYVTFTHVCVSAA